MQTNNPTVRSAVFFFTTLYLIAWCGVNFAMPFVGGILMLLFTAFLSMDNFTAYFTMRKLVLLGIGVSIAG